MSTYEPSSPESDVQCFSPGSCDGESTTTTSKKLLGTNKTKRLKASARERRRRHVLNDALDSLRRKVSTVNQNPHKLSKIEVLRLAIDYISMLSCYLDATADNCYAPYNSGSLPQQQLFSQYSVMAPQNLGFVEDFRKENQLRQVNTMNGAEFDVYLRGYGNM